MHACVMLYIESRCLVHRAVLARIPGQDGLSKRMIEISTFDNAYIV